MKNQRIVKAYNTVTPTPEQKQRMLQAIMQEADFPEEPVRQPKRKERKEPVIYTARPTKTSKKSLFASIAACFALLAVSGAVLVQLAKTPPASSHAAPTETTAPTETAPEKTFPEGPTQYGIYNAIIEDCAGYLDGTIREPFIHYSGLFEFLVSSKMTSGLGWTLYDLDENGMEELLISDGDLIYMAFSLNENASEAPILFTSALEEQYHLCKDGIISRTTDCGGDTAQYEYFKVDMNAPDLRQVQEAVVSSAGEYAVGKSIEKAVPVAEKEATYILTEKYMQIMFSVTYFQERETTDLPDNTSYSALTGFAPYDEILNRYYQAVDQGWERTMLEINNMSTMILEDRAYGVLGWCLLDIDNNGQEELLISDGHTLYDSYTITASGESVPLMWTSHERTVSLCRNGIFRAIYGKEAGRTVYIYYKVTDEFTTPEKTIVYENGQYRAGQTEENSQSISKDEAGRIMSEYVTQEMFITRFMPRDPDAYDAEGTYAETLQLYRKALTGKWNMSQCAENDISWMISHFNDSPGDVGYTYKNLDGGEEELIITDGRNILDLYTVTDGQVTHVLSGAERINYSLMENNQIFCHSSAGAALSYYTLYQMVHPNVSEENGLVVREAYIFDADADREHPWFTSLDGETLGEPCGSFDAEARTEELMTNYLAIEFRPFN